MRTLLSLVAVLVLAGCGTAAPSEPVGVPFAQVDLGGAVPVRLAAAGTDLLVAVRRGDAPGLVRRSEGGTVTELPLLATTGYGERALWYSLAVAGQRVLAVGGKRGGAHGNVRWSVWDGDWAGDTAGVAERAQPFSTFGGLGAGDLVDGVLTDDGPVLVGTWASARAGSDIAVWTAAETGDGTTWTRQSSADTALESSRETLKFPMAATGGAEGVVIAGWVATRGRQRPAVWSGTPGNWTMTVLPDAGRAGLAAAVACWGGGCAVAGSVDGRLAAWRSDGRGWVRTRGLPAVAVDVQDRLVPPLRKGSELVVTDREQVQVVVRSGAGWVRREASGLTGLVTAVAEVGGETYLVAGESLWSTDAD